MPAAAVLVDTGPLVALFDPSDRARAECLRELGRVEKRRLVTSLAVVTEASYLLEFSQRAQQALLGFVASGAVELPEFGPKLVAKAQALMTKYADLPMDFADATLVVLAEGIGASDVFTLDRRDFGVYRLGRRRFTLLPKS